MTNFLKKLAVGVTSAAILSASVATSVFAGDIDISGNGAGSLNVVAVKNSCYSSVKQTNSTNVVTVASVSASTGGNTISGNTGGTSTLSTGDATAGLSVMVEGGTNTAEPASCCACQQGSSDVTVEGNGVHSANIVLESNKQKTKVTQRNRTNVLTVAEVRAKVGGNKIKNGTGTGSTLEAGSAEAGMEVVVTAPSNSTP